MDEILEIAEAISLDMSGVSDVLYLMTECADGERGKDDSRVWNTLFYISRRMEELCDSMGHLTVQLAAFQKQLNTEAVPNEG